MSFGALRSLALDLNLWAHGLDILVYVEPNADPVETRGVWLTDTTNEAPLGASFARREALKVMAIAKSAVSAFPRGLRIVAPRQEGETATSWLVDSVLETQVDHVRVVLVPEPGQGT